MPYHLEKGPIFATIEALYNDRNRLPGFLHQLWQGNAPALGSLGLITSPIADNPNALGSNATGAARKASMREDWFGENPADGRQPDWGTPHFKTGRPAYTTGYWFHYYGNVREIVAKTLTRAAEVALGAERPDPLAPPAGNRHWRVEFFWKCGQPRFEGWVTWRNHENPPGGQVTVIFATPATPDQVLRKPADGAMANFKGSKAARQGMWVCSHEDHRQYVMLTSLPTPSGQWLVPISTVMFTRGMGDVGTWAPTFGNGGAPPDDFPAFQPGP
jgi:hypothetical protein